MNDQDLAKIRYAGSMRIIESMRHGFGLIDTLNDLAQGWNTPAGQEAYAGAVESLMHQYLALRGAGYQVSHPDQSVADFLSRPGFSMAIELTRLLGGGSETSREFSEKVAAMASAVEQKRSCFTIRGQPLAMPHT